MKHNVNTIISYMTKHGHTVFVDDNKSYNLNIVAIRTEDNKANTFNDILYIFYREAGKWVQKEYNVTVDPGKLYRIKPINPAGTAIVMPGQYKGMWQLGLHRGKYRALVQKAPCTVARDNNRDTILDHNIPSYVEVNTFTKGGITFKHYYDKNNDVIFTTETGIFGINCHKAGPGISIDVSAYSAGCIVFADSNEFDKDFLQICENAAAIHGNSFTFTLLLNSAFN